MLPDASPIMILFIVLSKVQTVISEFLHVTEV